MTCVRGRCQRREPGAAPGLPRLRRALAAADTAAGALSLRVLSAALRAGLAMPELRRAPDDRPHEPHRGHDLPALPRLDAEAGLTPMEAATKSAACAATSSAPAGSLPRSSPPTSPASAPQVAEVMDAGARRDPRRRHGRALRPADHDRPARRGGDRRPGPRCRRSARRPSDDRAPRAIRSPSSPGPAPTRSASMWRRPRTQTARSARSARLGCLAGIAINPAPPRSRFVEFAAPPTSFSA